MADKSSPLSTSALAKALSKTTRQMFMELDALGWIERQEDSWILTKKGEFEGGSYRESQRFGRYIIWPATVMEHKALLSPDARLLSLKALAKHLELSARITEQLLQEIGWAAHGRKGWLVTPLGEAAGACQREHADTGIPYILWSETILDNDLLSDWAREYRKGLAEDQFHCCDGHQVSCEAERKIDNWLYLAGLVHAYQRRLPCDDHLYADFYLPRQHIYIEYWGKQNAGGVAVKMRKRTFYQQAGCRVIELDDEAVDNLETVLPRLLLKYGVEI